MSNFKLGAYVNNDILYTRHTNAGFFSCCSVKLDNIIQYYNIYKKLPNVDSSKQFEWYKDINNMNKDITFEYFENYNNINLNINTKNAINYKDQYQYLNYQLLDYNSIVPFVIKYFSPAKEIVKIIDDIKNEYKIEYNNVCVLFYRGNDKNREYKTCGYEEFYTVSKKILEKNPNIIFLIQSDETEFIEYFTNKYPNNSFYLKNHIRHMKKCNNTVDFVMKDKNSIFSKYYLAITIIMSKCKYVVCGTGNCSIWIMLYRGNFNNVCQNLHQGWISNI